MAKIEMKTGLCISIAVMICVLSISSEIEAATVCNPYTPATYCKVYEVPRRRIFFHLCGPQLKTAFYSACGKRKRRRRSDIAEVDNIFLERQRANQFLSSHHVTKRSFNAVEECCIEGCDWEEIFEYCKTPYLY